MRTFEQGDVIKVPFPYTDRNTRQSRPALVVSRPQLEADHGVVWVSMITSAANRGRAGDIEVADLDVAGLPVRSVIRTAKIATIDSAHGARLGRVDSATLQEAIKRLQSTLAVPQGSATVEKDDR